MEIGMKNVVVGFLEVYLIILESFGNFQKFQNFDEFSTFFCIQEASARILQLQYSLVALFSNITPITPKTLQKNLGPCRVYVSRISSVTGHLKKVVFNLRRP